MTIFGVTRLLDFRRIRQVIRVHAGWVFRGVLFVWLVAQVAPPSPRAPLQEPQTVQTLTPHLCVHTRLIDEVDEWKIQRTLQLVREMGAPTIVEFFPWAYIESQPDLRDWTQADRIVLHARNQGIRIIARMGLVPAWAQQDMPEEQRQLATLNTLPEQSFDEFAEFVAAFAERYAGTIDQIIIWNEPNLAFEWGYQSVNAPSYVRLLRAVYSPVHAANPDVQVLAAALAPTLEPEGSPAGLNDVLFLEQMYAEGAKGYFDALAVHTYGFTLPPDDPPAFDRLNFRRVELLRDVMESYGDNEKDVFITETGWNDHPRWTNAVTPSDRIDYTLDALRMADSDWDWLNTFCLWVFRFPAPTLSYPDHFTLVTTDFNLRPIYHTLRAYSQGQASETNLYLPAPEPGA